MNFKDAVIYQIYPRSFADSNGDGIGDLPGIISRLDYLASLNVDILWLSPIYQSPNVDNGYDISDYEVIMPEFGTMNDFDALLAGIHQRGMQLILDLVVNHSSDEHPWFQESRKSKDNPYRNYYIWRPGTPQPPEGGGVEQVNTRSPFRGPGGEPNNWQSFFSGSAWALDEATGEYYLHLFAKKQPDLNWEHPPLRQAIYRMMRFWLDKGVDGFRMDVIPFLSKDPAFPDYPAGRYGDLTIHANGPRIHEFLQEMHEQVFRHYDRGDGPCVTVGEGFGVSAHQANLYVGRDRKELDMIYHFDHAVPRDEQCFVEPAPEFTLPELKRIFARWDKAIRHQGWQNIYFGNHDNPRLLSRFGSPDQYPYESATLLATVLVTQRGTPSLYQGDEIGMTNCPFDSIMEYDDVQVKNAWETMVNWKLYPARLFLASANQIARDHARTPFQWSDGPNAGFTTGSPWLKVNPNYRTVNMRRQDDDPNSVLTYYRRLLSWRRRTPAIRQGDYRDELPDHPTLWVYERTLDTERYQIIANVSPTELTLTTDLTSVIQAGPCVFSNYPDLPSTLRPYEVRIVHSSGRSASS